jgi:hypothetical protein
MIGVGRVGLGEDAALPSEQSDRRHGMSDPARLKVRTGPAARPSSEVARARILYLASLRERIRDGTYLTRERVDRALQRMLQAVRDDLPSDPID